jgi:hypothetical protein
MRADDGGDPLGSEVLMSRAHLRSCDPRAVRSLRCQHRDCLRWARGPRCVPLYIVIVFAQDFGQYRSREATGQCDQAYSPFSMQPLYNTFSGFLRSTVRRRRGETDALRPVNAPSDGLWFATGSVG